MNDALRQMALVQVRMRRLALLSGRRPSPFVVGDREEGSCRCCCKETRETVETDDPTAPEFECQRCQDGKCSCGEP
jgi:hypothetical protein